MTMLSFRVDVAAAVDAKRWADRLGVHTSELLRDALHRHLVRLESEVDVERWQRAPRTADERSLDGIAAWGPAEDWSDWGLDATR